MSRRLPAAIAAAIAAAFGIHVATRHTIALVHAEHLLPRWDLATHLSHGWQDYHLLVTGRIFGLIADLWQQGYWPPGLSLFQLPFFMASRGDPYGGLWSGPVAFTLAAAVGAMILLRSPWAPGVLGASTFVLLLTSSPFLLAYGTVSMTEMLGALTQLLVVLAYAVHRERPTPRSGACLALSFTALFFVKYNYFFLLAGPFVLHLWLERTRGSTWQARTASLVQSVRWLVRSPTVWVLAVYGLLLAVVVLTGGIVFTIAGQRVSVRSIGSSGHVVVYGLLARLAYLHWRGRVDWKRLLGHDPLLRPFLVWFAVPVVIWIASPYPNHIRDIVNLVVNRPMGEEARGAYLDALRSTYFYGDVVFAVVLIAFGTAVFVQRSAPPWVRLLSLAIPMQFLAIAGHQTRFTRFLLLTVVLLCLVAAHQIGRWLATFLAGRIWSTAGAVVILVLATIVPTRVVQQDRFKLLAFEHYTRSGSLKTALAAIRGRLTDQHRLVVVGQSNDLSPALFRLALGPPSGGRCSPYEIGGSGRLDLSAATHLLLLSPGASGGGDPITHNESRLHGVLAAIERQDFRLEQRFTIPDVGAELALYARAANPSVLPACR